MLLILLPWLALRATIVEGLDNGLARLPPLGWTSGERFGCNTDCDHYPHDCISELLVASMANAFTNLGYKAAGYQYLSLGDCWQDKNRTDDGQIRPDRRRFPSGPATVPYLHVRGLRLGVYLEAGNISRHGYPGSGGHLEKDISTLASWGVDMLTLDAYSVKDTSTLDEVFPLVGRLLNKTGRPILFNCIWPVYQLKAGIKPNWPLIHRTCNMFSTRPAMRDSWDDLKSTFTYFGDSPPGPLSNITGPGTWSDAGQVVVGDFGLSRDESRLQLAVWSILASPLFVSADLWRVPAWASSLLLNPGLLALAHEHTPTMGRQVTRWHINEQVRIWERPVQPPGSHVLAFTYENISGGPSRVSVVLADLGLRDVAVFNVTDVISGRHLGMYKPWHTFNTEVDPTGVVFVRATAII